MISRGVQLLRGTGIRSFDVTLYGQDWFIEQGHRVGVLLSSANTDQFTHVATRSTVTVLDASIELPFLTYDRTEFLDGESTPRLLSFLAGSTSTLSPAFIESSKTPFGLPPALIDPSPDPVATALTLEVVKTKKIYTLTAVLTDATSGLPLEAQTISFSAGGTDLGSAVTDAQGRARLTVPKNQLQKVGTVSAEFAGTDSYEPSGGQATVK